LELRFVDYRGKRVLNSAHVPILNVLYDGITVEYRDWLSEEAGFNAVGFPFKDNQGNSLPGFLHCSFPPQTIFETGKDGPFFGVAFYESPSGDWTLSTMCQAGWYRYYLAYTFSGDGSIRPRVGFTTDDTNPYAGYKHFHHAFFRFDFDIGVATNNVVNKQEFKFWWDPLTQSWKFNIFDVPINFETKLYRNILNPSYTILQKGTNLGYRIISGENDGTAANDDYGSGDMWFLRYRGNEIDDGVYQLTQPSKTQLDKFNNMESIDAADIVIWYGVHFTHDPDHTHGEKDFGPNLHPYRPPQ
jgi:hypothetical protein